MFVVSLHRRSDSKGLSLTPAYADRAKAEEIAGVNHYRGFIVKINGVPFVPVVRVAPSVATGAVWL
jgi:hypothetical protein